MTVRVVGIDCATDPKRVGYAFAVFSSERTVLDHVAVGSVKRSPLDAIADWMGDSADPALLALDAPLGWPVPLSEALRDHQAGLRLPGEANMLFRRYTDRVIRKRIGKQSLDVGADRIARTAHAALELLDGLRSRLRKPIPLAWCVPTFGIHAIEVYPAATLAAHGIDARGYKATSGRKHRETVLSSIGQRIAVRTTIPDINRASDGLDAALCVLTAHDFLVGAAIPPDSQAPHQTEGWIWVRDPDDAAHGDN